MELMSGKRYRTVIQDSHILFMSEAISDTAKARLAAQIVIKPWGVMNPPAPFAASSDGPVGEIWFSPPPELPDLLVKFIFTSEPLSVQVHPSNQDLQAAGLDQSGKEECWLILDAEPGALLAIGFNRPVDAAAMRAAALDGSIEQLLTWHPVKKGDFFYIPAGTVHAIGAGISMIEIQQNSDITYRLFDYGRPRELHLDAGLAVARGEPYDRAVVRQLPQKGAASLVDGPLFRLDCLSGPPDAAVRARYGGALLVIPIDGTATIAGEAICLGDCAVTTSLDAVSFAKDGRYLITQPVTTRG